MTKLIVSHTEVSLWPLTSELSMYLDEKSIADVKITEQALLINNFPKSLQ